jgi:hypothetical protein
MLGTCNAGWGNCDGFAANGCETRLMLDDPYHCGDCFVVCDPPGACVSGRCVPFCNAGWGNCDGVPSNGCETPLTTLANCGSCGTVCELANAGESCATGVCTLVSCDAGWGDCDAVPSNGCETNLLTSDTHCGSCGNDCGTGSACADGSCL